jgi:hypothetical protein
MKLLRVSIGTYKAQRSIERMKTSAYAKTTFVGSSTGSTLLKQA